MIELPFVTIIMPIRNEAAYIERSLGAVLAQDYPSERMEILVADGMSDDGTREIVRRMMDDGPQMPNDGNASVILCRPSIAFVDNPGRIVPTGLNAALRLAKGEIIVRVDGHCEIAPNYVRRCVEHLQQEQVDAVGGPIQTVGDTFLGQTIAVAMSSAFGVGGQASRIGKDKAVLTDTVAFPAYTRSVMEQAGPFDEELVRNQDDEYNYRLRKLGAKILLAPDVRSRYYGRSSLRALWRQYFQYGLWKVRVLQKHPRQMRMRQFAPPTFVAAVLGSALLAAFTGLGRLLLALIAGSYVLANLAASVWTAHRHGWRHLLPLPAVFATLHFSYGIGFLVGLAQFAHRWRE